MKKIDKKDKKKIEEITGISQWFLSTLVFYVDEIRRKYICA
jgi:nicotinamide mononucleotide (NMN) deamidase PncC